MRPYSFERQNSHPFSALPQPAQPRPQSQQRTAELCPKHQQAKAGYHPESKAILCNQCLFDSKQQNVQLTALVCKNLQSSYLKVLSKHKQEQKALD